MSDPRAPNTLGLDTIVEDGVPGRDASASCSLLLYTRGGSRLVPLRRGGSVEVGRDETADVCVRDRSLSRRHARIWWADDGVCLEDLGSTNGTHVNGQRIQAPTAITPDDEVMLGGITVALHALPPPQARAFGLDGHDRWLASLEREVVRGRAFGRKAGVLMVRALDPEAHFGKWVPRLRRLLRAVDEVGLYGGRTVELLLPEVDAAELERVAHRIVHERGDAEPPLVVGAAMFPEAATSAEALLEVAHAAALAASASAPIRVVASRGAQTWRATAQVDDDRPVVASAAMRQLYETLDRIARASIPVLVVGETGVGKEVVARRLHELGRRAEQPMLSVNCGAIPPTLLESTLFGHEKGAFTGALRDQKGLFESANGGTVFLDEIGELPPPAQVALLRVLETKRLVRVGSTEELEVDVRVVAATHRDLDAMVASGSFREDLLYRLNAMTVEVPPLRARTEEIGALAERFLGDANAANGAEVSGFEADAMDLLRSYAWPGNVRELKNVVERAVVIAGEGEIGAADLPERVRRDAAPPAEEEPIAEATDGGIELRDALKQYEAKLIVEALRATDGNQTEAAKRLGLPLRTLVRRIGALGIRKLGYST